MADDLRFIPCTRAEHGDAILAILNEAIVNSTALYDYVPRPPQAMDGWFQVKQAAGFPVLGVVDAAGTLLGFASWGSFRAFPAYKYTVEHSVYVHHAHRGRGLGRALLQRLIDTARQHEVHTLVGCIDAANTGSIGLHLSLGFVHAGTVREAGFKFGRWLDAAFYQLTLPGRPPRPVDG